MKRSLLLFIGCMLLLAHVSYGQGLTVSGKITDENGDAILGASILLKGTSTGTITDLDGMYTLNVNDGSGTLVFSYIGYETTEVPINGRTEIMLFLPLRC